MLGLGTQLLSISIGIFNHHLCLTMSNGNLYAPSQTRLINKKHHLITQVKNLRDVLNYSSYFIHVFL